MDTRTAVEIASVTVTAAAIWLGIVKLEPNRPYKFVAAVVDYALLIASLVFLGPLIGSLIGAAGIALWFIATSVKLAIEYDEVATDAAIHWRIARDDSKRHITRIRRSGGEPFAYLGPVGTARLAAALSRCARTPAQTEVMAKPMAMLGAIFHRDPADIAPRIDRLMRHFGEPPEQTMHVADVITRASQLTPGSFDEVMDGLDALSAP